MRSFAEISAKYPNHEIPIIEFHNKVYTSDKDFAETCNEVNIKICEHNSSHAYMLQLYSDVILHRDKYNKIIDKYTYILNALINLVLLYLFFSRNIIVNLFGSYWIVGYNGEYTFIKVLIIISLIFGLTYCIKERFKKERPEVRSHEIKPIPIVSLVSLEHFNRLLQQKTAEEKYLEEERIKKEKIAKAEGIRLQKEKEAKEKVERAKKEAKENAERAEAERKRQEWLRTLDGQYEQMKKFRNENKEYVAKREQQEREEYMRRMEREYEERLAHACEMEREAQKYCNEVKKNQNNVNSGSSHESHNTTNYNAQRIVSVGENHGNIFVYGEDRRFLFSISGHLEGYTSDSVTVRKSNGSVDVYDANGNFKYNIR